MSLLLSRLLDRSRRSLLSFLLCIALCLILVGISGCSWFRQPPAASPAKEVSDELIFDNVTLEQPDERGQRLWQVRAVQAIYSPSGSQAKVMQPRGELFRDNQASYEVEANEGEGNQDGEFVFLRG